MKAKIRVEVWYTNGLFRAYPKVDELSIKMEEKDRFMSFTFGEHNHSACINMDNVNFIEYMNED